MSVSLVNSQDFPNNSNCRTNLVDPILINIFSVLIAAEEIVHQFQRIICVEAIIQFSEQAILIGFSQTVGRRNDFSLGIAKDPGLPEAPVEDIAKVFFSSREGLGYL